ncbi:hypothetical protein LCGC14_2653200, partial [marine sediment metagenome]
SDAESRSIGTGLAVRRCSGDEWPPATPMVAALFDGRRGSRSVGYLARKSRGIDVTDQPKPMRVVFGETLCELAEQFPDMVVLDADVSSSTQTCLFGRAHPNRFYNFGIAEANMVSAAAGMAASGLLPVVSSFAFLLSARAADAVRSNVAYPRLSVKLCGGYAGLSDFADGASHQSVMDLAVMRAMPNMTVLVPSDNDTIRGAVGAMLACDGPVYLRISRQPAPPVHAGDGSFEIGRARTMRAGADVTLAVCGTLLGEALRAADALAADGIAAEVLEFGTVKPLDVAALTESAAKTRAVVTVGIDDTFAESGPYEALLDKYGLTAPHIAAAARELLETKDRQ